MCILCVSTQVLVLSSTGLSWIQGHLPIILCISKDSCKISEGSSSSHLLFLVWKLRPWEGKWLCWVIQWLMAELRLWPRSPYSVSSSCNTEVWSKGFYSFICSFVDTVLPQKGAIMTRQCAVINQVILEIVSTRKIRRSSLFISKVNGNKLPWEHWITHLQAF